MWLVMKTSLYLIVLLHAFSSPSLIGIKMNRSSLENDAALDFLVDSAARYKILCDGLNKNSSIPETMRFVGFPEKDVADRALQMRVRRAVANQNSTSAPNQMIVNTTANQASRMDEQSTDWISPLSSMTEDLESTNNSSRAFRSVKSMKLAAVKKTRSTAKQVRAKRALKKVAAEVDSDAFKQATKFYAIEKAKGRQGKSCAEICRAVNQSFGSDVKDRTVRQYVQKRLIGVSPKKRGRIGFIPLEQFNVMVAAAETFITIRQLGRLGAPNRQELRKIVNTVANSKTNKICPDRHDDSLIDRILSQQSTEFTAQTSVNKQEERRVAWTTYSNLNTWFDSWKHYLIALEFAKAKEEADDDVVMIDDVLLEGEPDVSPSQLRRIVNLDETNISLDGSDGKSGGRPSVIFSSSNHANPGKAVSKAGQGVTMIGGSNAAGEPFPPHFQFPSEAQSEETKRVHSVLVQDMLDVFVQFGHREKIQLSAMVGMNPKGGMDNVEFHKYLLTLVPRLYPDAADVAGKRVMIKCDSGPGRDSLELLADLRVRRIYLFPAVPNSSAVTQEMDQCYGPFKSGVRQNLDILFQDRLQSQQINSVGRNDIGMIVFGRTLESGRHLKNVFESSFSVHNNKQSWRKVGAVPLTRACLDDAKVRHEVTIKADGTVINQEEGGDPLASLYDELERSNRTFVGFLVEWGYERADLLSASVARKDMDRVQERITAPHSQERIDALSAVNTAGGFFRVTGGSHLTADEVFIGGAKKVQGEELKLLKKRLKESQFFTEQEAVAKLILQKECGDDALKVSELESLVKWKLNVKTLPKDLKLKGDKLAKWIEIKGNPDPISTVEWTPEDQFKLEKFESGDITIEETELGRKRQQKEGEVVNFIQSLDPAKLARLMDRLNVDEENN